MNWAAWIMEWNDDGDHTSGASLAEKREEKVAAGEMNQQGSTLEPRLFNVSMQTGGLEKVLRQRKEEEMTIIGTGRKCPRRERWDDEAGESTTHLLVCNPRHIVTSSARGCLLVGCMVFCVGCKKKVGLVWLRWLLVYYLVRNTFYYSLVGGSEIRNEMRQGKFWSWVRKNVTTLPNRSGGSTRADSELTTTSLHVHVLVVSWQSLRLPVVKIHCSLPRKSRRLTEQPMHTTIP